MEKLPLYISIVFTLTTLLTIAFFYKATVYSKPALIVILLWLTLQGIIALTGFYTITDSLPPRLLLLIFPPVALIAALFITPMGRRFIDGLNKKVLTLLHIIRIPVELVLLWLFIHNAVPGLMTFEGRNFDILSGITAPLIYYFGFVKARLSNKIILTWNFLCLFLLINIVVIAILSAPSPFQKYAFNQPNIAIMHFPFIWLPSCVVPIVLFSHLAMIRQLLSNERETMFS